MKDLLYWDKTSSLVSLPCIYCKIKPALNNASRRVLLETDKSLFTRVSKIRPNFTRTRKVNATGTVPFFIKKLCTAKFVSHLQGRLV